MKNVGLKTTALMALSALISCVNTDYDLNKEIHTEATLFENIAVPVGNLSKITVDDILFTEESEMIRTHANGDYYLDLIEDSFVHNVEIPAFSVEGMRLEDQIIYFNLPSSLTGTSLGNIDMTINYGMIVPGGLSFDMDITADSPLPSEILGVSEVYMDGVMTCNYSTNVGKVFISNGFELSFPEYIHISADKQASGYQVIDEHKIRFTADKEVSADSPLSIALGFDRINLPADAIVEVDGKKRIVINDKVSVNGDLYIRTKDFTSIPQSIKIVMHIGFDNLTVTKAKVGMSISQEIPAEEIIIGEMPDLLAGRDASLDVYNPYMDLKIDNASPFDFYLVGDVTSYGSNGSDDVKDVHLGAQGPASSTGEELFVNASSAKTYCFSRRKMTSLPASVTNIEVPVLGELIQNVPEKIMIHNMNVSSTSRDMMITAGATYPVTIDYAVCAPLSFGRNLNLQFTQDVENLGLTFAEAAVKSAELKLDIINTIPIDFMITATCLDQYGNVADGVSLSMDKAISGGTLESPATSTVKISLRTQDGVLDVDALKLTMKAYMSSEALEGVCLNKNQGFEIKNIVLCLPDGVGVEF